MTIRSEPPALSMQFAPVSGASTCRLSSKSTTAALEPVILMHGDIFGFAADTMWSTLRNWSNTSNPGVLVWSLVTAGHPVYVVWTGVNWGSESTVAYPSQGGAGLDGIDALVASLGASRVHLVGVSMGGLNAAVWASRNVSKVGSLTLLSPCVDPSAVRATCVALGTPPWTTLPDEIDTVWTGAPTTQALCDAALEASGVDAATTGAALTSIADHVQILTTTQDVAVLPAPIWAWADRAGVPMSNRFEATTGSHAACMTDPVWDDLRPLRLAQGAIQS